MGTPFHDGERWMQARVGVREKMEQIGERMILPFMPDPHRQFFTQLPTLLLGAVDEQGQPHASILWGAPGFAWSPHPQVLSIAAQPEPDDPIANCLRPLAAIGVLGLEWHSRRRNRMNGRIVECDEAGLSVAVAQAFGNCPKYIQARRWQPVIREPSVSLSGIGIDSAWRERVAQADTLFIASSSPNPEGGGVDISHRGGPPGLLRFGEDGRLWLPDYSGNRLFNTLGNLISEPRCGLLFIDFERGDLLQLEARAELVWPEQYAEFGIVPPVGAERMLAFTPGRWTWRQGRLPLAFATPEPSPFLPLGEG
ncbi:pyridoxamine 5'-phosphate oxidase family protein [Stutzerimonas chloritidismutans]|uniref:pyridoxamine 5'-phosphate oxidase family protein n=1 Tax=Stutzerimonas chloritidismutans TaxID=203192 RepID=UPI003F17A9F9